jgi:hypothetical protein
MKKKKILVLMHESLVPPDSIEGLEQRVVDESEERNTML